MSRNFVQFNDIILFVFQLTEPGEDDDVVEESG